ncbi:hypothetical protein B0H14DRAFT_2640566 [Mycena olivaceomarginata]|nr:hypothetical protein B0H14DRAFT_2640566 [Mycena olivaceomarginata]
MPGIPAVAEIPPPLHFLSGKNTATMFFGSMADLIIPRLGQVRCQIREGRLGAQGSIWHKSPLMVISWTLQKELGCVRQQVLQRRCLHCALPGRGQEEHLVLGVLGGHGWLKEGWVAGGILFWAGGGALIWVAGGAAVYKARWRKHVETYNGVPLAAVLAMLALAGSGEETQALGFGAADVPHVDFHRVVVGEKRHLDLQRVEVSQKRVGEEERGRTLVWRKRHHGRSPAPVFKLREEAVGRWQCSSRYGKGAEAEFIE